MKFIAFGAGEKSKKVKALLERFTHHRIVYYLENENPSKIGSAIEGVPVISIHATAEKYREHEIDGVVITTEYHKRTVQDMIAACENTANIKEKDIYLVPINVLRKANPERDVMAVPYRELAQLYQLSIHLTDHCNLNCEACCHSAPFVSNPVYADLKEYEGDLRRLSQLVPNIVRMELVGGEPLLHPQLPDFLQTGRALFPYTDLYIVTNGILLLHSSDKLKNAIRENDVGVVVSLYPPMHEQLGKFQSFFREERIRGDIFRVEKFFKKFCDKPYYDAKEQSAACGYCMGLEHGEVRRCIDSFYVKYLNQKFNLHLPEKSGGINIYTETLTGLELVHKLEEPIELCAYCANKQTTMDTYEWRQVRKDVKKEDVLYRVSAEEKGWDIDEQIAPC